MSDRPGFRSIVGHIRPRLPRAGKIRLGITTGGSTGKKGYPKEVDYFVLDPDLPGRAEIIKAFGHRDARQDDKNTGIVRRILITFHSDEIEDVFPHAYKLYSTGGLLCTGNGEEAQRAETRRETYQDRDTGQQRSKIVLLTDKTGRPIYKPFKPCVCPFFTGEGGQKKMCKAIGNLMFAVPEAALRIYQIDTGSWHSAQNVVNSLLFFKEQLGGIRGRLFALTRVPTVTQGGGKTVTHYPLAIEMPTFEEKARYDDRYKKLSASYGDALALPEGAVAEAEAPSKEEDIVREDELPVEVEQVAPSPRDPEPEPEAGPPEEEPEPESDAYGEFGPEDSQGRGAPGATTGRKAETADTHSPSAPGGPAPALLNLVCHACGSSFRMARAPKECPDCGTAGSVNPEKEPPASAPASPGPRRPSAAREGSVSPAARKAVEAQAGPAPAAKPRAAAPSVKPAPAAGDDLSDF